MVIGEGAETVNRRIPPAAKYCDYAHLIAPCKNRLGLTFLFYPPSSLVVGKCELVTLTIWFWISLITSIEFGNPIRQMRFERWENVSGKSSARNAN